MTIASEIQRIKNNIASAYTACTNKGANIPSTQNSANLASCINSISVGSSSGGGSNVDLNPLIKKAWGWTSQNTGKTYFVSRRSDGTFQLMGAGNFKTLVKNFSTNYMSGYNFYILDGEFYYRNTSTNAFTKCQCDIHDWIGYTTTGYNCLAIRADGSLYYVTVNTSTFIATASLVDNTGVWTKLASFYTSPGTYGIRNGQLCVVNPNQKTYTVKDSTGTWTDVCCLSYGVSGYGIKDGKVYYIAISTGETTLLSDQVGFTAVSGDSYGLAICNGALYSISGSRQARLIDNTQTWVKLGGSQNAITSTGKLYYSSYGSSIQQVGTDTTWTDVCGQSSGVAIGLNNGNVYRSLSSTSALKQMTFDGDITQIDGVISSMEDAYRTCAVFVSNNPRNKNIYTVAYPDIESKIYFDANLTVGLIYPINSVDSNLAYIETLPKIDGSFPKYYRNSNIDTNFTQTPHENLRTETLINILEGN